MPAEHLGRILIVANPTAHSGGAEAAAIYATRFFSSFHSAATSCEVRLTEAPGDATLMASAASNYDTVIALGGDGIIHEVVNGLMTIPQDDRPRLGILPMGSGNDFARTLGFSRNDAERSIVELLRGNDRYIDLGKVNDTYFMQTLSFGIDAAIALDTTDRRANNTSQTGTGLFVTSGLKIITQSKDGWSYHATIDGEETSGTSVLFAVQNGPTYGGGFRICPDALPCDGVLDLCMTRRKPLLPCSLALFGLARLGKHTVSRTISLRTMRHMHLEFDGDSQPPCQIDGEKLEAPSYDISVAAHTLQIIVPASCPW